mgnify:CR=1 FL=1
MFVRYGDPSSQNILREFSYFKFRPKDELWNFVGGGRVHQPPQTVEGRLEVLGLVVLPHPGHRFGSGANAISLRRDEGPLSDERTSRVPRLSCAILGLDPLNIPQRRWRSGLTLQPFRRRSRTAGRPVTRDRGSLW